jgi:phage repressor protein C with HTH and peptisase S24 domain
MELQRIIKRIDHRLKAVGMTANKASKEAGKPDAIRNLKRAAADGNRQGATTTTIAALAPVLKTTVQWLLEGQGPEDITADVGTIPVWGKAGAGGTVNSFHEAGGEIGRITRPSDANDQTGAVEIEGDSLGQVFNGWFAVYDEVRHPPTSDLIGELCVIELTDGRVFIKKLTKGRGKRFTLVSNYDPPIYDVDIKWAAKVKNVVRR